MKILYFSALPLVQLLLVSCSGATAEEEEDSFSLTGKATTIAVALNTDSETSQAGDWCFFPEDFGTQTVYEGVSVTLRDAGGEVIGVSELGEGGLLVGWVEDGVPMVTGSTDFVLDSCVFPFEFSDVQSDSDFFSIQVGTNEEQQLTRDELLASELNLFY